MGTGTGTHWWAQGRGGLLEKKLELTQKFGSGSKASSTSRGYRTLTVCLLSNLER